MGIWDFINSTTETVKRNSPDLTPIKNACSTTFGYGTAAASLVDNAVRVNGLQKVYQYMPDEEARAKIGLFANKFAKNSAVYVLKEGYKLVPGGNAVAKIASKTVHEMKSEDHKGRVMKVSKENRGMEVGSNSKRFVDSIGNQKPEDVLRVFMMKEFIGTHYLDDLIVPGTKRSK